MEFKTKEGLAKFAVEYFFLNQKIPEVKSNEVSTDLHRNAACFVSIYIDNKLSGCMGDYFAKEPLYQNIIKNAICAAFSDFRFPAIQRNELPYLKTEVSVLTTPVEYKPKTINQLLKFLGKEKPGVLLEKDNKQALFLPQVWEKLPEPSTFLSQLCRKAGLPFLCWQEEKIKYWIFNTL